MIFFTPVIVRYMKKNLDKAKILYRGSTVHRDLSQFQACPAPQAYIQILADHLSSSVILMVGQLPFCLR